MTDLHIPDSAGQLTFACGCSESGIRTGYLPESIPLIVAAELRKIADEVSGLAAALNYKPGSLGEMDAYEGVARTLRARADELDPAPALPVQTADTVDGGAS